MLSIFILLELLLLSSESSSGDRELRLFPSHHSRRLPPPVHPENDFNPEHNEDNPPVPHHLHLHHLHHHHPHSARLAKVMPSALSESRFQQPGAQPTVNLLARPHHGVHPEHAVVSARHLVTVVSNLLPDWVRKKIGCFLFPLGRCTSCFHVHLQCANQRSPVSHSELL